MTQSNKKVPGVGPVLAAALALGLGACSIDVDADGPTTMGYTAAVDGPLSDRGRRLVTIEQEVDNRRAGAEVIDSVLDRARAADCTAVLVDGYRTLAHSGSQTIRGVRLVLDCPDDIPLF